jgi:hypothetical protein
MARRGQDGAIEWKRGSGERDAHWRQVLADWSRSGLSKVAFCRKRGLSASAFHWWKVELVRRDAAKGSLLPSPSSAKGGEAKARPAFVAVRLAEGAMDGAAVRLRANGGVEGVVEVVLMHGRRVRVGSGFDAELLAQVVQVLEGMAW